MKKFLVASMGLALVCGLGIQGNARLVSQEIAKVQEKKVPTEEDKIKHKALMAKKLALSQDILKALVLNDLPEAKVRAEDLIKLRKEAAWMMKIKKDQLADYNTFSNDFTRSAEKVIKSCKENNLDRAKFGYLEMTLACFNCHAACRDMLEIKSDLPNLEVLKK